MFVNGLSKVCLSGSGRADEVAQPSGRRAVTTGRRLETRAHEDDHNVRARVIDRSETRVLGTSGNWHAREPGPYAAGRAFVAHGGFDDVVSSNARAVRNEVEGAVAGAHGDLKGPVRERIPT